MMMMVTMMTIDIIELSLLLQELELQLKIRQRRNVYDDGASSPRKSPDRLTPSHHHHYHRYHIVQQQQQRDECTASNDKSAIIMDSATASL